METCSVTAVDKQTVDQVRQKLPGHTEINELVNIFKILGDSTRLQILLALSETELCVCDLAALVGLSVSAVSHQLRLLRDLKLVKFRKEWKKVYYSLDDYHIENLIADAREHVNE